jgi:hypothetical protein
MMPSKHYVSPFSAANALEPLTTTDRYLHPVPLLLPPQPTDTWINLQKDNQYFGLDVGDTVRKA